MSAHAYICTLSLVAAFLLSSCNRDETSEGTPLAAKRLAIGTPVRLITEEGDLAEGDFAEVETADSHRYYVNLGVLKSRSTATSNQDGFHTHVLSAATDAYAERPAGTVPDPEPRSAQEISAEQRTLNRLYLTEQTERRIIASTMKGRFVDEVASEEVWPACTCHNPDCPKRGTDEDPYLFVITDADKLRICPACVDAFDLRGATDEELRPYHRWTELYQLKETSRRIKQLDAERKRAFEANKR